MDLIADHISHRSARSRCSTTCRHGRRGRVVAIVGPLGCARAPAVDPRRIAAARRRAAELRGAPPPQFQSADLRVPGFAAPWALVEGNVEFPLCIRLADRRAPALDEVAPHGIVGFPRTYPKQLSAHAPTVGIARRCGEARDALMTNHCRRLIRRPANS